VGRGFGIRDGNGTLFSSHDGSVKPSGFLPVHIGNVRTGDLLESDPRCPFAPPMEGAS